jgi:hypothetical protein
MVMEEGRKEGEARKGERKEGGKGGDDGGRLDPKVWISENGM